MNDARPCSRCGGTERYDSGGCVPCTRARVRIYDQAHKQQAKERSARYGKAKRAALPFGLTERQVQVMESMSRCRGDRELVADELRRRVSKIDYHMRDICTRMRALDDTQAIAMWDAKKAAPTRRVVSTVFDIGRAL